MFFGNDIIVVVIFLQFARSYSRQALNGTFFDFYDKKTLASYQKRLGEKATLFNLNRPAHCPDVIDEINRVTHVRVAPLAAATPKAIPVASGTAAPAQAISGAVVSAQAVTLVDSGCGAIAPAQASSGTVTPAHIDGGSAITTPAQAASGTVTPAFADSGCGIVTPARVASSGRSARVSGRSRPDVTDEIPNDPPLSLVGFSVVIHPFVVACNGQLSDGALSTLKFFRNLGCSKTVAQIISSIQAKIYKSNCHEQDRFYHKMSKTHITSSLIRNGPAIHGMR